MSKRNAAIFFSFLLLPVFIHARVEGHFDRTLQVSGAVSLDVLTGSGDIVVKTGGSNQVVVHGRVTNDNWFGGDAVVRQVESNPPIEQSGNSIRLGYNMPYETKRRISISYEIVVPADTTLQAHTGSGNVDVAGLRSSVQAQTGSGDIRMRELGRGLRAQTGSGNITAQDVAAPFYAQTGSGDIEAALTGSGDVDAHTGSGNIKLRGIKGGARARTGSGEIQADGGIAGPWDLHSGSGNIRMAVGSAAGFNLDVHTSSGSIHSDLPITMQGSMNRNTLRGTVKGGGPTVEVSTSSGDVEIR
jgi:hypothetical protein